MTNYKKEVVSFKLQFKCFLTTQTSVLQKNKYGIYNPKAQDMHMQRLQTKHYDQVYRASVMQYLLFINCFHLKTEVNEAKMV